MKLLEKIALDLLQEKKEGRSVLCEYVSTPMGMQSSEPFLSNQHICQWCQGSDHYTTWVVDNGGGYFWLCANSICLTYNQRTTSKVGIPTASTKRSLEWPVFCENQGIGDNLHDITFEKVNQDEVKVDYMRRFSQNPRGFIVMQGEPGSGKTYAALGLCELFTRSDSSAMFITYKQLRNAWRASNESPTFFDKLLNPALLVIDDFGIVETPKSFMELFMDLLNSRMQWKRRGTVITTNLDDKMLSQYCGDALADRLATGITFEFKLPEEGSRRKPIKI